MERKVLVCSVVHSTGERELEGKSMAIRPRVRSGQMVAFMFFIVSHVICKIV